MRVGSSGYKKVSDVRINVGPYKHVNCVRGTRTQPPICVGVLCIIGCRVQLIREVFLRLHFHHRHTFASL